MISIFQTIDEIEEVYQYGQTVNQQFSLVLGFRLANGPRNSEEAFIAAVQQAIRSETLQYPLDIFFIESNDTYQVIKGVEGALLYKKML